MKKLSLVVAVALGTLVACSFATAQEAGKDASKKGKRGYSAEQRVEQLKKDLSLTDEQVPKVNAALEEQQKKMQELRSETDQTQRREKMRTVFEETNKKMKGILTEDQYKKYEEMHQRGGKRGQGGKKSKKSE
jgi:protein CpxP